jgi:hypothetical protein
VPLSYVTLNVKKGTAGKPEGFETKTYEVKIIDSACKSSLPPNNAFAANLEHIQKTNTEGHLTYPFQPFGKYELCLSNATTEHTYTFPYTNSTVAGSNFPIYPTEHTKTERETEEATLRTAWKKEQEIEHKITLAERTTKETTQTTERAADEGTGITIVSGKKSC